MNRFLDGRMLIGCREWCALPTIDIPAIKVKIDTGARTSSLHAFGIKPISKKNKSWVGFYVFPIQGNKAIKIYCETPIVDERYVISSSGHREMRYIIDAELKLGFLTWKIELSLSNRDSLRFRMLLGREAFKNHVIIDPSRSFFQGKIKKKELLQIYSQP